MHHILQCLNNIYSFNFRLSGETVKDKIHNISFN